MNRNLIQRIYLRTLRQLGMKKLSWDQQFKASVSCYGPRSTNTLSRVQGLCRGGRLLEFGCGEGDLPFVLPVGTYASYAGFDISGVAIERAKQRTVAAALDNVTFEQSDMAKWDGMDSASLILAEECLYYLSTAELEQFLLRCTRCLTGDGSILVIVHSAAKHASTLDTCRRVCMVRDQEIIGGRVFLTLASRLPVASSH